MLDEDKIKKLEAELALYKGKAFRRRREIKALLRHNDLLRQCWHKEIALSQERMERYRDASKKLFRFAKWAYVKFHPESHNAPGTFGYTCEVNKWLCKWESEIDERPKNA